MRRDQEAAESPSSSLGGNECLTQRREVAKKADEQGLKTQFTPVLCTSAKLIFRFGGLIVIMATSSAASEEQDVAKMPGKPLFRQVRCQRQNRFFRYD